MADHHQSAKALILKAAERSGLLQYVAEALWFANKHRTEHAGLACIPCAVLCALTEVFDDHATLTGLTCESVLGSEGLAVFPPPAKAHEVRKFSGDAS